MLLDALSVIRATVYLPVVLLSLDHCRDWSQFGENDLEKWLGGLTEDVVIFVENPAGNSTVLDMATGILAYHSKVKMLALRCRTGYRVVRSSIDVPGFRADEIIGFDCVTISPS